MATTVGLLLLVAGFSTVASGQTWHVNTWHVDHGLPHVNVTAIAQTPDGYLWVGTPAGLARFDGMKFKVFRADGKCGLEDSRIANLLTDREGTLWVATLNGALARLRGQHFEPAQHPLPVDQDSSRPTSGRRSSLLEDSEGGIWWYTPGKGIARYLRGHWSVFTEKDGLPAQLQDLARDERGTMWAAGPDKLLQFDGQRWISRLPLPTGWESSPFAQLAQDGLWVVSFEGKLICRSNKKAAFMESALSKPSAIPARKQVTALLEDHRGNWWAGLNTGGVCRLDEQAQWRALENAGALVLPGVTCLFEDRQGNLWAGSSENGLHRIATEPLNRLPAIGAPDMTVTSCCTRDGTVWVGTCYSGVLRRTDWGFESVTGDWGEQPPTIISLFVDSQDIVWAGTDGGLFRYEGGRFQRVNAPFPRSTRVFAILESRAGELWFGTYAQGLFSWHDGALQGYQQKLDIRSLAEDASGALWVGTINSGLYRLSPGTPRKLEKVAAYPARHARAVHCDPHGTLWVDSWGEGLFRYRAGKFENVAPNGWPCDKIQEIFTDPRGTLWAAAANGIFSIPLEIVEGYVPGKSPPLLWRRYSSRLDFNQRSCTGIGSPVVAHAADGRFWLPNMEQMAIVDPAAVQLGLEPANVRIEAVSIDGKEVPVSPGEVLRVSSAARQFEFRYTAIDLTSPSALVFRAKLDGMDTEWTDPEASRSTRYSKLPPGEYQFHIIAGGADGLWHEAQPLRLVVTPQWWEREWFQIAAAVTAIGSAAGATLWYQKRKTRAKLRQVQMAQQLEAERARIARDIHDEMGANLTQIMMLSNLARESHEPDEAIQGLDQIHATSRDLTRAMDEIVWAVDPKHDTLDSVVNYLGRTAEDSLRAGGVRCRLDFPRPIPKTQFTSRIRHELFLLLKEALHNVVKHASATEGRLAVEISDSEFRLILEDNGKGFSLSSKSRASDPDRVLGGHGLENMAVRAQSAGGKLEIDSQPGRGTRLILRLPLPSSTP